MQNIGANINNITAASILTAFNDQVKIITSNRYFPIAILFLIIGAWLFIDNRKFLMDYYRECMANDNIDKRQGLASDTNINATANNTGVNNDARLEKMSNSNLNPNHKPNLNVDFNFNPLDNPKFTTIPVIQPPCKSGVFLYSKNHILNLEEYFPLGNSSVKIKYHTTRSADAARILNSACSNPKIKSNSSIKFRFDIDTAVNCSKLMWQIMMIAKESDLKKVNDDNNKLPRQAVSHTPDEFVAGIACLARPGQDSTIDLVISITIANKHFILVWRNNRMVRHDELCFLQSVDYFLERGINQRLVRLENVVAKTFIIDIFDSIFKSR